MSGTWISQIQAELCKRFPASKDYKAADFKQSPMPVSVGHFLEHALSRRAATIQVSVDEAWFDRTDPAVADAERRWREALTAAARYPASLWEQSLHQAVSLVVSFMITPAESFCEFAFAGSERGVHPKTMLNRLAYFKPYPRLREVVRGHIQERGAEHIEPADLRAAMLKADRAFVPEYEPSDWIALLTPLFEIAEATCAPGQKPEIPMDVLKRIFEAKGADDLVRRLEAIESIGGRRMLSETGLLKAIGPTEIPKVVEEPEKPAPSDKTVSGPVQRNDVHVDEAAVAVPRWMQFAAKVEAKTPTRESGDGGSATVQTAPEKPSTRPQVQPDISTSPAPHPIAAAPAPMDDQTVPQPMRVGERARTPDDPVGNAADSMASQEVNPVEERVLGNVGPVRREKFVAELFSGNYAEFLRVVSMLDMAGDWESAAHVIGAEIFERNQVDIYSESAIEFTNVVESRFQ